MRKLTLLLALAGAAGLVACASQPPAAARAGQAAPSRAALTAQQKKDAEAFPGYYRVVRRGQEKFCRNEAVTGSRISQEVCFTRAELEAQQSQAAKVLESNRENARTCEAAQGLGGNPCQN